MPEENPEKVPLPAVLQCPVSDCDWTLRVADFEITAEIEVEVNKHTESHPRTDYLNTIGLLQLAVQARDQELQSMYVDNHNLTQRMVDQSVRIQELERAVRGAGLLMGLGNEPSPVDPGDQKTDTGISVVRERKHGDVVPGRGTLVGKRLPDHIAKELGINRKERNDRPDEGRR